jgi:hypothetical protein
VAYFILSRDTDPATTGLLYTFPNGDRMQEMRITNQKGTVRLARGEGNWTITEPGNYRANQQKARIMEEFLLALPVNRQLRGTAPEYGLEDPQATIEMTTTSGIRKALLIGNLTASKAQVYLKDRDSGKIFVSDLGSVTQFDGSLDAYRDKDIFSVDKNSIVEFSFYNDGQKQVTVGSANGQDWQLTYPYEAPARRIEINEFLVALRKWAAAMYPPREQLDYKGLGLDAPRQALELVDAKGNKQRIELGAEADGLRFIRSGSEEDVAGIFAVDVDFSNLDPASLVFYQPLQTTIDRVASIELTSADRSAKFELDHSADPPRVTANGKPVSYEEFVSLFVKYVGLSADGHDSAAKPGEESLTLKTTYLDGQTAQVRLLERDAGSKYMQVNDQASFYLSDQKVGLLLDRLDAAIAAGQ